MHNFGLRYRRKNDAQKQIHGTQIIADQWSLLPEMCIHIKVVTDLQHDRALWSIERQHIQRSVCRPPRRYLCQASMP